MKSNKIYIIQIITVLFILLIISIIILYRNSEPINYDYKYKQLYTISRTYDSKKEYFECYDLDYDEKEKNTELDENGIYLDNIDGELIYNPSDIAQYGLILYSKYIETNDFKYYDSAKIQADYLVNIQDKNDGGFYHEYKTKIPSTNEILESHWISALTQGKILSLLSRMYYISKNEEYKISCELAIKPFSKKTQENGLCASFFGNNFYEFKAEKQIYSLNSFMYSLIGLNDFYNITNNEQSKKLYDDGIKTLRLCLPYYDYNRISLQNLSFMSDKRILKLYSEIYHIKHIMQLEVLNQFENDEILEYYINKWQNYVIDN